VVLKDEILRLVDIPLVIRLPGMPQVARGLQVKLDLLRWDEVDLTVEARLLEIPTAQQPADAEPMDDEDEAMLQGMEDAAEEDAEAAAEGTEESAENSAGDETAGATPVPAAE